jgi:hypothetical protein
MTLQPENPFHHLDAYFRQCADSASPEGIIHRSERMGHVASGKAGAGRGNDTEVLQWDRADQLHSRLQRSRSAAWSGVERHRFNISRGLPEQS